MSRTLAFIQARMSSSRFPGKVVAPLGGVPMIVYMVRRVRRAVHVDEVVVVTSTDPSDDALVASLELHGVRLFRGDLTDVLKRFADAATACDATEIVRLTGDCPLIDPAIIDAVIDCRRAANADYASNIAPPTFPDGLDAECCTRETLDRAHRLATHPAEREHVTLWMRGEATPLRRANVRALCDLSHLRLTVDYRDDLEVVRNIVARELEAGRDFDLFDVLRILSSKPDLLTLNPHARNEGLLKSLGRPPSPTPHGAPT